MKSDQIFNPPPQQWGLRGDPHLWNELATGFDVLPDSKDEFKKSLIQHIEQAIGQQLTLETSVQVERFKHGGMSSGCVCGQFWINQGIPPLLERYDMLIK